MFLFFLEEGAEVMQDLCLLAASLVAHGSVPGWTLGVLPPRLPGLSDGNASGGWFCQDSRQQNSQQKVVGKASLVSSLDAVRSIDRPEFSSASMPATQLSHTQLPHTQLPHTQHQPSGFMPVSLEASQAAAVRPVVQQNKTQLIQVQQKKAPSTPVQSPQTQQNKAQQDKTHPNTTQQNTTQQNKAQSNKAQSNKAQAASKLQQNTAQPQATPDHSSQFNPVLTQGIAVSMHTLPTGPATGGQLYQQRTAALRVGRSYTRIAPDSFLEDWLHASTQPNYQQWVSLLRQEATVMARGQGKSHLSVLLGDSLSMWFPSELLPRDRFWLNQGISGDTTAGVLRRLHALDGTRPDVVHVMVGINDLRRGATDLEVVSNLQQIMRQLKQEHPDTRVIVHSILPTRLASLPSDRIRRLNYSIAMTTKREGVFFLNLQPAFTDEDGLLRRDFTTDGLHLNARGYETWQSVIASIQEQPTDALIAAQ
ncbi:MAG TPA: SGNH/GDSL hydrolase family protein [Allocoleopsis sp.]